MKKVIGWKKMRKTKGTNEKNKMEKKKKEEQREEGKSRRRDPPRWPAGTESFRMCLLVRVIVARRLEHFLPRRVLHCEIPRLVHMP